MNRHEFVRVYVWEAPVRLFHWVNAFCILVLCVTGYLIAHPPALMSAHAAYASYWFGTIRFLHFVAAYVFIAALILRLYWAAAGNKYARWRNFLPLTLRQWKEILQVAKADVLELDNNEVESPGHNAVAYFTYTGAFLLAVFQIVTGFALYAGMSNAWFPRLFGWAVPLFGSEYKIRVLHYAVMWLFVLFTMIHVYLGAYHDYIEGNGVMSSIIGGWKFMPKKTAEAPQASGISPLPPAFHQKAMIQLLDATLVGEPATLSPSRPEDASILVLGVGNLLMGDEGAGVHALRLLETETPIANVRLLDGGTGGVNLLTEFEGIRSLILIDATRDGSPEGSVGYRYRRYLDVNDIPRGLSAHDFGLKDLFAAAALIGIMPQLHLYTIAVNQLRPMSTELSPAVAAALPEVVHSVHALAARLAAA